MLMPEKTTRLAAPPSLSFTTCSAICGAHSALLTLILEAEKGPIQLPKLLPLDAVLRLRQGGQKSAALEKQMYDTNCAECSNPNF